MVQLKYGRQNQVSFKDLYEYYLALGFLSNSSNAELRWENNEDQGAWGSEGRIHCLIPQNKFPQNFKFTAGRGKIYARINCNDYVATLVTKHCVAYNGMQQNIESIMKTVPERYRNAFMDGYNNNLGNKLPLVTNQISNNSKSVKTTIPDNSITVHEKPKYQADNKKTELVPIEIGEHLRHIRFGVGTVIAIDGSYIRMNFESVGPKSFVNPMAFSNGFLTKNNK